MPIQNTEQVVEAQKGKPRCVIYFSPNQVTVVKRLAGDIRAENKIANLVAAALFDETMVEGCHAIAIQASVPKANLIARAYRKHRPDVEQHWFSDEGDFVDPPEIEPEKKFNMPITGAKANDTPVDPEPPSEEEVAAAKAKLTADLKGEAPLGKDEIRETQDEVNARADAEADASREAETDEATDQEVPADADSATENSAGPFDAIAPEDANNSQSEKGDDGGEKPTQS